MTSAEELAASLANPNSSGWQAKGDQHRTYRFAEANADEPYRLYVPTNWDGMSSLPLAMFLHGAGSTSAAGGMGGASTAGSGASTSMGGGAQGGAAGTAGSGASSAAGGMAGGNTGGADAGATNGGASSAGAAGTSAPADGCIVAPGPRPIRAPRDPTRW
jgi:hypothetical protein